MNQQDPQTPECPKCGSEHTEPADDGFFKCQQCGTEFDPTSKFTSINY